MLFYPVKDLRISVLIGTADLWSGPDAPCGDRDRAPTLREMLRISMLINEKAFGSIILKSAAEKTKEMLLVFS